MRKDLKLSREQLDAIRARVEAATPGPWALERDPSDITYIVAHKPDDFNYIAEVMGPLDDAKWERRWNGDTALIANAPTDLRALLAEVERLNARIVAVAAVITENGCMCDCGCDVGYGHFKDSDCNPCLVCRVSDALLEG